MPRWRSGIGHVGLVEEPIVTRLRLARRKPCHAAAVLDDARVLRANLYACLTDNDDGEAFAVVARFAEAAAKVSVFGRDDSGLGRWTLPLSAGLRLPVHAAARSCSATPAGTRYAPARRRAADGCS